MSTFTVKVYPEQQMKTYFSAKGFTLATETASPLECELWTKMEDARKWALIFRAMQPLHEQSTELLPEWLR